MENTKKDISEIVEPQGEEQIVKYPRIIRLLIEDKETDDWLFKILKDREQYLQKELALITLKLYALYTNDYSDLPPSAIKDLEELKARMDNGEDIVKTA